MAKIDVRKGMPDVSLTKDEFAARFREQFHDPGFEGAAAEIERIVDVAWTSYAEYHKNPRMAPAGPDFSKPDARLPVEWLAARRNIMEAERRQKSANSPSRILLINGSMRSDQTCPGEMSKSWRLMMLAKEIVDAEEGFEVEVLDLSRLASEYGRLIHPCKSCVSTAMPLCHWPCSCYPNFAMGQVNDWMAEIYPMWVSAHGVMIVTPVNWYQAPSGLKAMIDRLVCADGGNPDPTSTDGKDPSKAKELELRGWPYPRHLAGRVFSLVVHGDAAGTETLRRILSDWLTDMGLIPSGKHGLLDAYIGYMGSYAESHRALDADEAVQVETRNAVRALVSAVRLLRAGRLPRPDEAIREPRPK
ncbi:flavodoxin family protein [Aestuariivirga sp.]|uniref:flavodoxin family protein n=1 Tax=Aestuariivirga sp. TaxID=2650926 RepID=UPI00391C6604